MSFFAIKLLLKGDSPCLLFRVLLGCFGTLLRFNDFFDFWGFGILNLAALKTWKELLLFGV
jgi:hypothetical protein